MLDSEKREAIRKYAEGVSVPLLRFRAPETIYTDRVIEIGTGTLLKHHGRVFLVTARHVVAGHDPETIIIPIASNGAFGRSLASMNIHIPDDEYLDFAVVEITSAEIKELLGRNWTIIPTERAVPCPQDGDFYMLGYPWATLQRIPGKTIGRPVDLITRRLGFMPESAIDNDHREPVYSNVDLFFEYPETYTTTGVELPMPPLNGISGCAVWAVDSLDDGDWNAANALKFVGVQSGLIAGEYIRAKMWRRVGLLLDKVLALAA